MATKPDPTESLSKRAWTVIVAVVAVTAGVSAFLLNIVGIRDAISKLFFPDQTVEINLRDATTGPMSGMPWSTAISGYRGFDIEFIVGRKGTGSVTQCVGELNSGGIGQSISGGLTPEQQDDISLDVSKFDIDDTSPASPRLSIRFYLPEAFIAKSGKFDLNCGGNHTNVLDVALNF